MDEWLMEKDSIPKQFVIDSHVLTQFISKTDGLVGSQ